MEFQGRTLTLEASSDVVTITTECGSFSLSGHVAGGKLVLGAANRLSTTTCGEEATDFDAWFTSRWGVAPELRFDGNRMVMHWVTPEGLGDEEVVLVAGP